MPEFRADPPNDFKPDTLNALTALMLAQAHECIWQKSVMEHMRHGTIARLAIKVSDYYQLFLQQLQHIAFKKKQRDEWQKYGHLKFSFFLAVAHYQKANEAISSGRYGEEVARLRLAQTHNPVDALVHSQFKENISMLHHGIQRDIARAERDNDLVYMEPVPEPSQLVPILRSDMVKPILPHFVTEPAYWTLLQPRQEDEFIKRPLFEHLLPFAVHQAASVYADKKDYIIKVEIQGKNQDLTKELQE